MQRISVSLPDDIYEALRLRAFHARLSVDRTARSIIELGLAEGGQLPSTPSPERATSTPRETISTQSEEVRTDFKRQRP